MNIENNYHYKYYLSIIGCFLFFISNGQSDTTGLSQNLEPVFVKATKIQKQWLPAANSIYNISTENKDQFAQNSLQEFLIQSPSVFALNANNRAQDLRISIRGFGSRAAFGVRGVKVIVDGIPETTTDGQGQLDNLNLGIIERIEILNNGSSALYGNASGGVINIMTTDESAFHNKKQFLELGTGFHSFGGQQYQLTAGKKLNKSSLIFHANHHQGNGYRDHSSFQSTNFNFRLIQELSGNNKLEAILNYMNSPTANDPGGVTLELFDNTPEKARDRNEMFDAGEAINQLKGNLRYTHYLSDGIKLLTYGFYSNRNFQGRLPFSFGGLIELQRNFLGHGTALSLNKKMDKIQWTSSWGYDLSTQRDFRERFLNLEGAKGEVTLSQDEEFSNVGIYGINDFTFDKLTLNVALRYDFNHIKVVDQKQDNGDDSGRIDLNDFNYSLGLSYQIGKARNLFATYSTSFETPTLNELSNNPDGSGFNPNLKAQEAQHFELGVKGIVQHKTTYQASAFYVNSTNELLPFELDAFPERTFFRNVGSTERFGIELFLKHAFSETFSIATNWAVNQFTFEEYELDGENFEGNFLPGLPNFQGTIQFDLSLFNNLEINYQNQIIGKMFTNDSNTVFRDPISISNISLKYNVKKDKISIHPYLGVNNLLQAKYADNIRINAFGQRYYEAAPDLFIFGGIRIKI